MLGPQEVSLNVTMDKHELGGEGIPAKRHPMLALESICTSSDRGRKLEPEADEIFLLLLLSNSNRLKIPDEEMEVVLNRIIQKFSGGFQPATNLRAKLGGKVRQTSDRPVI
jgi:hypothetical protein